MISIGEVPHPVAVGSAPSGNWAVGLPPPGEMTFFGPGRPEKALIFVF